MASTALVLAESEGALGQEGVLVPMGAQAREGARAREGCWCQHLQSRLRGDNPACSLVFIDVCFTRRCFYSFRLSSPLRWQFWMYFATA
jgi:hypothetical protein